MEREIDLSEISDGKLYTANDMVKIGCNDCAGCSECCRIVGDTIVLDPYDLYQLKQVSGMGFEELMKDKIELRVVEGIVQPNLKMRPDGEGCAFLSSEGRCTIHNHRPGFCRMFPMGRIYQEDGFRYFLQVHECLMPNKTKVKVGKWVDTPQLEQYEAYIRKWHSFLETVEKMLPQMPEEQVKNVNLFVLKLFFLKPYEAGDFYSQFQERMTMARDVLEL